MPGTAPELRLDDQLCFALYAASRAMTARYRPHLDALGITYPQYVVLVVLWDEGELAVRRLGDRLRLDSGTLSPLLRRLEQAGLVDRRRDEHDDRAVLVAATPRSRQLRDRAACIPLEIAGSLQLDVDRLRAELHLLEAALRDTPAPTAD